MSWCRRRASTAVFLAASSLLAGLLGTPGASAAGEDQSWRGADFNGDGFDDLAIGVRGERIRGTPAAGTVQVLPGSATGLSEVGDQRWSHAQPGVPGDVEEGDWFGFKLAAGDFDGDGFDDLVMRSSHTDGIRLAGEVVVLYGSAVGLTADRSQLWSEASEGIADDPEQSDGFGNVLAVGDFNGDGHDDLAATSGHDPDQSSRGLVHVIFGSPTGLRADGSQAIQDPDPEYHSGFGHSLAGGDLDGDGDDELVVGSNWRDVGTADLAGQVRVFSGTPDGVAVAGSQVWHQDTPGVLGEAENYDHFGSSLVVGDINRDGFGDLVVGSIRDRVDGVDAGSSARSTARPTAWRRRTTSSSRRTAPESPAHPPPMTTSVSSWRRPTSRATAPSTSSSACRTSTWTRCGRERRSCSPGPPRG